MLTRLYSQGSVKRWYSGALTLVALFLALGVNAQGTIGIGTGTATGAQLLPINSCYGYNYTQQIVTASEYAAGGGVAGNITKIRFYYASGGTNIANWNNWTVYLGHTAKTAFTTATDWEPVANLTQVFTGTITPVAGNWFEITFAAPFNYNGTSNLIVAVDENVVNYSCTAAFGSYASTANSGIYYRSDSTNPDPAAPPTASGRTATLPRIQFEGILATCLAPSGVTAVANSTVTGTANWAASTTVPAGGYDYYVSATNTAPTAGTTPTGNVASGTLTAPLSGLTANTTYYVWVRSHCTDADMSSWVGGTSFTTPCDPSGIPYYQDFESATVPAIPACTSIQNAGTGNNWVTANNPGSGFTNKALRYPYNGTNAANAWFYTQALNLTGGVSYRINYKYGNDSTFYTERLAVAYGTANNAAAMTVLANHPNVAGAVPVTTFVDFTPATTGVYYIGFNAYSIADQLGLMVDDISVIPTPTCEPLTGVNADNTSFTTATVNWTAPAAGPALGYEYYYSTVNTAPEAATTASGNVGAGVTTALLTGLTASTSYYVWVRSVCAADNKSPWVGPASFFTGYCNPAPSSIDNLGITNVTMGAINNTTVAEPGNYADYSALSATADAGATVPFSITYQTGYTYGTKIWVDWNNDADFDDEGEQVFFVLSTNASPTTVSGSFMVPALASVVGTHRVRIGGTDNDAGGTPCYTGAYGTYEDYTLVVTMPDAPAITGFTPAVYCAADGVITITGTALGNAALTVGGTAVATTTNTTTQITATVPAGVSGVVSVTTVAGTATTTESFTVTTPVELTLSGTAGTICAGNATAPVTITAGAAAYDTYVWTPATGVTGSAAEGWVFNPAETTEYVLTASQSAGPCVVNVTYNVTVNPLPTAVTVTAAQEEVCYNGVVALTGTGGNTALDVDYCTPVLTQAGATGDYIANFAFAGVVNNGSNDPANDYTYYSAMTASVVAGAANTVTVQSGATFGQTFRVWIDLNQDGTFSADESLFSTATSSTALQTGTITVPVTAFNGTTRMRVGCRWSTAIVAGDACGHAGYGEYEDYNITITGATNAVEYVWTPAAGLYTDAAATVPYTAGTTENMVYAKVTAPVTYTATAATLEGCTASGTVALDVIVTPAPTGAASQTLCYGAPVSDIAAVGESVQYYTSATGGTAISAAATANFGFYYVSQTVNGCESNDRLAVAVSINLVDAPVITDEDITFCNAGTVADLTATGTGIQWYANATGGEPLAATTAFTEGTTVYYASQTVDGCESPARAGVAVTLNVTDAPMADAMQTFCNAATVADLSAEGTNVMWYAAETGGDALDATTVLADDVTYYAAQTVDGCTSAVRTAVMAMINVTPAPAAAAEQTFCGQGVVASLDAEGDNVMWYATETGGQALEGDVALTNGMMYYASQSVDGCESMMRTPVTVTIITVIADTMEDVSACFEYTLPELTNGAYYTEQGGTGDMLAAGTVITESTTLYIYAATGDCNDETSFDVAISATPAPEAQSPQVVTAATTVATIEDIVIAAQGDVTWYASEEDFMNGIALEAGTAIEEGATYYAAQTIDGCTSQDVVAVTISEILGGKSFDARAFSYYPNPVKDVLTLQYSSEITSVTVYNLLGQVVLTKQPNATTAQLDMAPLSEGTYMVTVTAGDAVQTIKVVKKQN